jgi:hypothetical protein
MAERVVEPGGPGRAGLRGCTDRVGRRGRESVAALYPVSVRARRVHDHPPVDRHGTRVGGLGVGLTELQDAADGPAHCVYVCHRQGST